MDAAWGWPGFLVTLSLFCKAAWSDVRFRPARNAKIIRKYYAHEDFALSQSNAAAAYLTLLQTTRRAPRPASCRSTIMQDLIWVGIILALVAASLGYARLCDDA
ncbi:MAG: hypothetical protein DI569_07805 [Sphingopyxis macrogoltabida]|uniref:Uncharacterized protein n=1 Tax=Sphingopyxis macrogoltabida TaxID=33050 RepID=A0A2W5MY18_SPHMC|nr:MAG: hypothetical protein DI569_07805 [Sphingopyxis macrogoltabida]